MVTLWAALLGFAGSLAPELLRVWREGRAGTDLAGSRPRKSGGPEPASSSLKLQGSCLRGNDSRWCAALSASVRPLLAYGLFALYAAMKAVHPSWDDEDRALLASVISFYFGQRAVMKVRG